MMALLKDFIRDLLWRPRIERCGPQSYIRRPRRIDHGRHVHIGARLRMLGHGVISPVLRYANMEFHPLIQIGDDVYIGSYAKIDCADRVEIGNGCVLSDFVHITDLSHGFDPTAGLIMKQKIRACGRVKLGDHCFVGLGSSILPGVTLGEWCVVGTRSVVTKSFPAYSMIAGSPARLIKRFSLERGRWESVTTMESDRR